MAGVPCAFRDDRAVAPPCSLGLQSPKAIIKTFFCFFIP
jgi:hypothetical protein